MGCEGGEWVGLERERERERERMRGRKRALRKKKGNRETERHD